MDSDDGIRLALLESRYTSLRRGREFNLRPSLYSDQILGGNEELAQGTLKRREYRSIQLLRSSWNRAVFVRVPKAGCQMTEVAPLISAICHF